jgi:transposase-like protein
MPRNLATRRERIQQAVSALTAGAQRRYPTELRSRIADYSRERIKAGVALSRVCSELGVSHPTLVRILDETPAPMRRVRLAGPKARKAEPRAALVVKGPGGLVIEGLDVEGVATLVRALS